MAVSTPDWEDLDRRVDALVAAAEGAVVRWVWARDRADWETPFELWEQRCGRNPVTSASKGTPDPVASVRYGYDEDDRIVLARRFTRERKDPVPRSEMVWIAEADGAPALLEIEHRWRPYPQHLAFVRLVIVPEPPDRDRAPDAVTTFWRPGRGIVWKRERYDRGEGGRVERITSTSRYDESDLSGAHERELEYLVTYDELGAMEHITSRLVADTSSDRGPTQASVQWVRSTAAAVRDAEAFLARELPVRVIDWVRRNDPKLPVYALALLYDAEDVAIWTPSLALATVQHLQQIDTQNDAARVDLVWNPATFPVFEAEPAELASPELLAAFRITGQAWGDRSTKKITALLKKVATDIREPVREVLVEPMDGFAVYAAELEDDFEKVTKSAFGAKAQRAIMNRCRRS
ncbi:hypothetical protein DSM104299_04223 [Baekduia alba]|uniref:hypothetical protein n=1 Tax=Baekduia alba TaxID=2997333 RepID=UPI002341392E|nr:hypothetical protein [Baekduia alba]WCB95476.1 hypothetical protein DSM104299_04223 [Baekduia alba]